MKKILIVGSFPYRDWEDVAGKEDVQVVSVSLVDCINLFGKEQFDLVVFPCEGAAIHSLFQENRSNDIFRSFFDDKSSKKVAWSMDSHHQWQIEIQYQHFFDTYYLAHSNYIDKFTEGKTKWLPCSLLVDEGKSRRQLLSYSSYNEQKSFDVVSVYRNYLHIGDRNAVIYNYHRELKRLGLTDFLGQTVQFQAKGMQRYYDALASGKIILNVSIKDDLNMRNFEALALNQIMVTNRVPDHDKIDLDYSNTVFFDRYDMDSFRMAMEEAMEKARQTPKRTVDSVINKHMLIHHYVEMFNNELGLELVVTDIDVDAELRQMSVAEVITGHAAFIADKAKGDIEYSDLEIATKGIYSFIQHNRLHQALAAVIDLLESYDDKTDWSEMQNDLLHILQQCTAQYQQSVKMEMLLPGLLQIIIYAFRSKSDFNKILTLVSLLRDFEKAHGNNVFLPSLVRLKQMLHDGFMNQAQRLLHSKKYNDVMACLRYIEGLGLPLNQDACHLIAEANRLAGNKEQALIWYRRALRIE